MEKLRGEETSVDGRAVRVAGGNVANLQKGEGWPGENDEVLAAAYHFKCVEEKS